MPARARQPRPRRCRATRCAGSSSRRTCTPCTDPLRGQRQLPLHLDSSARPFYDFASARDRAQAYQLVLLEATKAADLEQWLQHAELLRLWPELYLPRMVRAAWQGEHPVLARIGAGPHVPQL